MLETLLHAPSQLFHHVADGGRSPVKHFLHEPADLVVGRVRDHSRQVLVHRTDSGCDRHVIVIQHDDEVSARVSGIVQRLIGQSAAHRTISDDRDDIEVFFGEVAPDGHSPGSRDRGRCVTGTEGIVFRFIAAAERREAILCANCWEVLVSTGQDLVDVRLMAGVPDQLVTRGFESVVQRHGELRHAEGCTKMPPLLRNHVDVPLADGIHDLGQVRLLEPTKVGWIFDLIQ